MTEKQVDLNLKLAEISAQDTADKNALAAMQLGKIQCLGELLAMTYQETASDFSPCLSVISDEINRRIIENKIVELVKGL